MDVIALVFGLVAFCLAATTKGEVKKLRDELEQLKSSSTGFRSTEGNEEAR